MMMHLRYDDSALLIYHLNTYQGIRNQLAGLPIKFDDKVQALWFLGTLSNSWETFRMYLSNLALNCTIMINMIKNRIPNKEIRKKAEGSIST